MSIAKIRTRFWLPALFMALLMGGLSLASTVYAAPPRQEPTPEIPREPGILVSSVLPDSPAAKAGVKRGNILLQVNETAVNTMRDLRAALQDLQSATEVTLTVLHGDDERTLTVALDAPEGDEESDDSADNADKKDRHAFLGIVPCGNDIHVIEMLGEPSERFGFEFGFPDGPDFKKMLPFLGVNGARVMDVLSDGPAAMAGLAVGDIVEAVDGTPVDADNDLATLIQSYKPGDTVTLDIRRGGDAVIMTEPDAAELEAGKKEAEEEVTEEEAGSADAETEDADSDSDDEAAETAESAAEEEAGDLEKESHEELFIIDAEIAQIEVTLGAHPDNPEQAFLGVSFGPALPMGRFGGRFALPTMPFDPDTMPHFDRLDEIVGEGVVIMQVDEDSPAAAAGLAADDVITAINGEPIAGPRALADAVDQSKPGDELTLSVEPADSDAYDVVVTLGENDEGEAWLGVAIGRFFRNEFQREEKDSRG